MVPTEADTYHAYTLVVPRCSAAFFLLKCHKTTREETEKGNKNLLFIKHPSFVMDEKKKKKRGQNFNLENNKDKIQQNDCQHLLMVAE